MDPDKVEARCAKNKSRESEKVSGFCRSVGDSGLSHFDFLK